MDRPELSKDEIIQAVYDAEQTDLCKFAYCLIEDALRGESMTPEDLIKYFLEVCYWA